MVVIGRVTADAMVKTLKDQRQLVSFSVAENSSYKDKKTNEWVSNPTYFSCSYWLSTSIAKLLRKGSLVELTGRVSLNVWKDMQGETNASLNYHADTIKIHGGAKKEEVTQVSTGTPSPAVSDDLPF